MRRIVAPHSRDEAAYIQFLQADEEEEEENTDAQDNLDFGSRLDQSGYGAEDNAGSGLGDDRIKAEPLEYAFDQLSDDDHRTNGKEDSWSSKAKRPA